MVRNTDGTPEQIDKKLVARTLGQLGDRWDPNRDTPETRYVNIAAYKRYDDVHRALLIDGENPDRLYYAWTNDDRTTWKVEDAGDRIDVRDDVDLETPDDVDDARDYVQEWAEILLDEYRYDVENDQTSPSVNDEIEFVGQKTLRFRDVDGRMADFQFDLAETDD